MTDKVLVITGASRGIGKATAEYFRDKGFLVVNLSRSKPDVKAIEHLSVDLADPGSTEQVASALCERVALAARIVLVHNAGLLLKDSVASIETKQFERALRVNVTSPALINTILLPVMKPGSSILYVGSTLAEKAVANTCSYVVSKHAQLGLMRATCQDLAGKGIHTAAICPGFTETEMLSDHVGGSSEILAALAQGNALGRLVEPEEIARALCFAAENPVINGSVIHANLGQIET